jgi:hypothetical protein
VIVLVTSDKGGTGRSVTATNVAYRRALRGDDVAYVDFDFGSPTAGAIFNIENMYRGSSGGGIHDYFAGHVAAPVEVDVWSSSDRGSFRVRPDGAGRLVLVPGSEGGRDLVTTPEIVRRCLTLFLRLEERYHVTFVDLSAGRSHAADLVLAATAAPEFRHVGVRWLVFHRWTRQHVVAAHGLVHGRSGLFERGAANGHELADLHESLRYVATAVIDPDSAVLSGLRPEQITWLRESDRDVSRLASQYGLGRLMRLGVVPLDPMLQLREQIVTDFDVLIRQIANMSTVDAFNRIAKRLDDEDSWTTL